MTCGHLAIGVRRLCGPLNCWLIIVTVTLLTAVGCNQESTEDKIDRVHQQISEAAREPSDPQITTDNAADLLPIVLNEEFEFESGRAWTETGEFGFLTGLTIFGATDDDEVQGAVLAIYCAEQSALPAAWLILRTYRLYPAEGEPAYAYFSNQPDQRVLVRFGRVPDATWKSWGLEPAGQQIELADATNFVREAKRHSEVRIRVPLPGRVAEATFSLLRGLNTPIQPNLDWCGLY